jgi:hypothetical protein
VVYVGTDRNGSISGGLAAFDANGVTKCSGVPKVCAPLWVGPFPGSVLSSPAVANGIAYIGSSDFGPSKLYAFDAQGGSSRCDSAPPVKTCTAIWTAQLPSSIHSSPAIAHGVVWIGSSGQLFTFDAAGNTNCSGMPKTCTPLWTAGDNASAINFSSPALVNGVVYIGRENIGGPGAGVFAFDEAGVTNCSGSPKNCTPLWSDDNIGIVQTSPAVANGFLYVRGDVLYAYRAASP